MILNCLNESNAWMVLLSVQIKRDKAISNPMLMKDNMIATTSENEPPKITKSIDSESVF